MIARAALAGGRWSYESKFDGDLLLEELIAVRALDGSLCFVEGGVFDKDVALDSMHQHFRGISKHHTAFQVQCHGTYLHVTRPSVQVHVQVLDSSIFAKRVLQIFLCCFLVHVGHNDDPAFNGAHGGRASLGARVAGLGVRGRGLLLVLLLLLLGLVDFHLGVGHDVGLAGRSEVGEGEAGVGRLWCRWASREKLPRTSRYAASPSQV
jgi:hypothetical protein